MRRLLAAAVLVTFGMSVTAYAADPAQLFTLTELRADAHKQARTTVDSNGIPIARVSDQRCVDGVAGTTAFTCDGIDLLSFVPQDEFGGSDPAGVGILGGGVSDIWGWVDPEPGADGVHDEYVMLGKTNGVALFRITNPLDPEFLGQIPNSSPAQLVWHDIKVYKDHAFIVSESVQHGMNVFDLTRLRGLEAVPAGGNRTLPADLNYPTAFAAHNIAINEETGFAYIVGGNTGLVVPDQCLSGLHMVNIQNPKNPVFAGCHAMGEGRGTAALGILPASPVSYIHDTQCVVYRGPDEKYQGRELCFNSSEDHMSIVDVTDKLLPVQVAKVTYPDVAYAHQGWLTADQTHFLMGDELDEGSRGTADKTRTLVFDVSVIDKARFVGANDGETAAIDHNMYEKDGLFYQSNYTAGLRVVDSRDAANANLPEVAFFDGYPKNDDPTFNGTWSNYPYFPSGTVAFSGIDEGLFLVRVHDSVLTEFSTAPVQEAPPAGGGKALGKALGKDKNQDKGKGKRP
ncbi:MAG TPA: choice-of-anchor B family protein [Egibacteraceae bacterium]|nr:choice-of-anchor B family protein [Egibacteraceae bacterium]